MQWLQGLTNGPLRSAIIESGLARAVDCKNQRSSITVHALGEEYVEERTDLAERTIKRLLNSYSKLTAELGMMQVSEVTEGDAIRYARTIRANFGNSSHAEKLIRDASQLFTHAVKNRIIEVNPFKEVKTHHKVDESRKAYITEDAAMKVIEQAPNIQYAAIFAFARFAGFRTPTEHLSLKWNQVDWENNRLTNVWAQKTKSYRTLPIFEKVRPYLEDLWDEARGENVFCVARASANKTWRGVTLRMIERAGVPQWSKLFVNLRASCRTDLQTKHPIHVVNYWMNHTSYIGAKHYDRVSDEEFERASQTRTPFGDTGGIHGGHKSDKGQSERSKNS